VGPEFCLLVAQIKRAFNKRKDRFFGVEGE